MTPRGDANTSMAADDYAVFIAIDWADKKHVWALQKAGSRERQQGEIEARPETVETWVSGLLAGFAGPADRGGVGTKAGRFAVSVE